MIEQDYFMRMVSMLAAMISRIVLLKKQKDFPAALLEIQATAKTLLGIDGVLISTCSPEQLGVLLGTDPSLAVPKVYVLGLLLKEEADIRAMKGQEEESASLRIKSLELLLDAWLREGKAAVPGHDEGIEELLALLSSYALPSPLLEKVMAWHEALGRYDKAENVLFDIVAARPEFAEEGLRFYRRLLLKSDGDLSAGNLPREEILEGMAGLKTR